ncbi:hypothetical protein EVAR_8573_1 [Eumeta japonica]|uniref:Uncharacterized protein n=1 Tax=Eumeta variegata TaxID=151549 RepID=A0A4C1TYS5_EUMVA|nr:hypothetical protein EVAR_8573_1 [Eumeta japonica]
MSVNREHNTNRHRIAIASISRWGTYRGKLPVPVTKSSGGGAGSSTVKAYLPTIFSLVIDELKSSTLAHCVSGVVKNRCRQHDSKVRGRWLNWFSEARSVYFQLILKTHCGVAVVVVARTRREYVKQSAPQAAIAWVTMVAGRPQPTLDRRVGFELEYPRPETNCERVRGKNENLTRTRLSHCPPAAFRLLVSELARRVARAGTRANPKALSALVINLSARLRRVADNKER